MQTQTEEGETDLTEHYRCNHCQHQDNIANPINLASQLITGLLGLGVSLYLAFESLLNIQQNMLSNNATPLSATQASAMAAATVFATAFIYLLYRCSMAFLKRRSYVRVKR